MTLPTFTMTFPKLTCVAILVLIAVVLQGCGEEYHLCDDADSGCVGTARACAPDQDKAKAQCKACYDDVQEADISKSEKKKYQDKCLYEKGRQEIPNDIHDESTTHWSGRELLLPLRKSVLKHRSFNTDMSHVASKPIDMSWFDNAADAPHDLSWYLP